MVRSYLHENFTREGLALALTEVGANCEYQSVKGLANIINRDRAGRYLRKKDDWSGTLIISALK